MRKPISHDNQTSASPWVLRFLDTIPAAGTCLDVAAGSGRHTRLLLARGHAVTAVDQDIGELTDLVGVMRLTLICADLEKAPWPLNEHRYDAVIVTNYLWRPILTNVIDAVAPGGLLIYDTFAEGQAAYGRPRNPDFLLRPDELLEAVRGQLRVRAFEHGPVYEPDPAMRSRICAQRPS